MNDVVPPGPHRDAEIARLLGWIEGADGSWRQLGGGCLYPGAPPFSTDATASQLLIEEMKRLGYAVYSAGDEAVVSRRRVKKSDDERIMSWVADVTPLARITKAVLIALRLERPTR